MLGRHIPTLSVAWNTFVGDVLWSSSMCWVTEDVLRVLALVPPVRRLPDLHNSRPGRVPACLGEMETFWACQVARKEDDQDPSSASLRLQKPRAAMLYSWQLGAASRCELWELPAAVFIVGLQALAVLLLPCLRICGSQSSVRGCPVFDWRAPGSDMRPRAHRILAQCFVSAG